MKTCKVLEKARDLLDFYFFHILLTILQKYMIKTFAKLTLNGHMMI